MTQRRLLLIFPSKWVDFSPTLLNTISYFRDHGYSISLVFIGDDEYSSSAVEGHVDVIRLHHRGFLTSSLRRILGGSLWKLLRLTWAARRLRKRLAPHVVIGYDAIGYIAARSVSREAIFFSLEVSRIRYLNRLVRALNVKTLLVQTQARADYIDICADRIFLVQNSPRRYLKNISIDRRPKSWVLIGGTSPVNGIDSCISALRLGDEDHSLTIKPILDSSSQEVSDLLIANSDLLESHRLSFYFEYMDEPELLSFLASFSIGFCVYDPRYYDVNDFNMASSPAGKIFSYLAAGVPVVSTSIIGLERIFELGAGVAVADASAEGLLRAARQIEGDYDAYAQAALRAAAESCFDTAMDDVFVSIT